MVADEAEVEETAFSLLGARGKFAYRLVSVACNKLPSWTLISFCYSAQLELFDLFSVTL